MQNGGEDEIADMDEDDDDDTHMGDNTDDDNWLAFARIRSQAPHQVFIVFFSISDR